MKKLNIEPKGFILNAKNQHSLIGVLLQLFIFAAIFSYLLLVYWLGSTPFKFARGSQQMIFDCRLYCMKSWMGPVNEAKSVEFTVCTDL